MIEGNSNLHVLVLSKGVAVPQQHDLVMVSEVVVGDGDRRGAVDRVDQPVPAVGQRAVVHPNVLPAEDRYPVPVRHRPPPRVLRGVAYIPYIHHHTKALNKITKPCLMDIMH